MILFALMACAVSPEPAGDALSPDAAAIAPRAGGPHTLSFSISDYAAYEGLTIHLQLIRRSDLEVVAEETGTISSGHYEVDFDGALVAGEGYLLDYYVDKNEDEGCDGGDGAWRHAIDAVTGPESVARSFGDDAELDFEACWFFPEGDDEVYDFYFTGAGYTAHVYQDIHMNVVRDRDGVVVESAVYECLDAAVVFYIPNAFERGESYHLDWYTDINGDGACDSADHTWTLPLGTITEDLDMRLAHLSGPFDFDNGCDTF